MIYVRSKNDLSIDDDPNGSIKNRVPSIDWSHFNNCVANSIADGRQILRVNSVVGNYTYTFSCWNTQDGYDQFLDSVDTTSMNSNISNTGIISTKEILTDYTVDSVVSDIQSIGGDIYWWLLPEPYKHMEREGTRDWE